MEELPAGSALSKAGIEVGDRLDSWQRPDGSSGTLASPFDWRWLQMQHAPRGSVRLLGERRSGPGALGESLDVVVGAGKWKAWARPELPVGISAAYASGVDRLSEGDARAAAEIWRRTAGSTPSRSDRCWLLLRAGERLSRAGEQEIAEPFMREAIELAETPRERAEVWRAWGLATLPLSRLEESENALRKALETWKSEWSGGLGQADLWSYLAEVAETRGDVEATGKWLGSASQRVDQLAPRSLMRVRIWTAQGRLAVVRGLYDDARAAYQRAVELLQEIAPDSVEMAVGWMNLGIVPASHGDPSAALRFHEKALDIFERLDPLSLNTAACLNNLGALSFSRGDYEAAESYLQRALKIRRHHAPDDSMHVANNLVSLGVVAKNRGDLKRALDHYHRALDIQQRLAPNSPAVAGTLINLGNLTALYGDLAQAESLYLQSLEIHEQTSPESLGMALLRMNLGSIARRRGDFARAETWYREALELQLRVAPEGEKRSTLEAGLGALLMERGEFAAAEKHLKRALELKQERAPGGLPVASGWNDLGVLAQRRRRPAEAAELLGRALAIQLASESGELESTSSRINLGTLALEQGDLATAERHLQEAVRILEPLAPESHATAVAYSTLGEVKLRTGELPAATRYLSSALELFEQQGLESYHQVECFERLARIARRKNQPQEAWAHLSRAIEILEAQIGKLGGARELQGSFRARYGYVYRSAIEVLLELGRPAEAFQVLEGRRARSLLAMLAERDLVFADVPEELERQRRRLAARHDQILEQLTRPETSSDQRRELRAKLEQLHSERRALRGRIREASPRLAELEDPRPASLDQIRGALDPGTVLLSFSVGAESSHLFVVDAEKALSVFELDLGEVELRDLVRGFSTLIEERRNPSSRSFEPLLAAGAELYRRLLAPVQGILDQGRRALVVPDGPLFQLPFSALVAESPAEQANQADRRYWIEQMPVHTIVSATLYTQLRNRRPKTGPGGELVAFGDPLFASEHAVTAAPESASLEPQVRSMSRYFELRPLPGSRREAQEIAKLFADRGRLWLGADATEQRAKSLSPGVSYVHFATHGLLNERFPLDSAIVLSLGQGGPENGLLQVWEIFERVRVDADLVVLSACRTAAGGYVDGEGLIGLTRAFQYAGAASVVAGLWNVEDPTTAELMVHFYRELRRGMAKDDALRSAQLSLIGRADGSNAKAAAPYYWAAFQLHGDRR